MSTSSPERPDVTPLPGPSPSAPNAEDLFERYLDDCLAGGREPPERFCARHGVADSSFLARLAAVGRLAGAPAPSAEPAAPGLPFTRLGEFRLLARAERGGMGEVYLAEQLPFGRRVALKVLRPELGDSPAAIERFRREARAAARLSHPGIVTVHAFGEDQGVRYLAMEWIEGRNLADLLAEATAAGRPIPPARSAAWALELARALQHAHEHGVIHRDVKPANIRIMADGTPRLIDFGVARDEWNRGRTITEAFAGSLLYAAPEQISGKPVDGRVDVYALGATLYQCLTGRLPFEGETLSEQLRRILDGRPVPPRRWSPAVSRDLSQVVLTALEPSPARRYATAAAFAEDLDAALAGRPIRARPPGPLRRLAGAARRRPALAATIASLALGAIVLAAVLFAREAADRRVRRHEALAALSAARDRVEDYRESRTTLMALEEEIGRLKRSMHAEYTTAEEDRLLDEKEDYVEAARRTREASFYETLELLARAERLAPGGTEAAEIRADLYAEKWEEARLLRDRGAELFYRDRVRENDRRGRHEARLQGAAPVRIQATPADAEVHVFRILEQAEVVAGGSPRLVPVPRGEPPPGLVAGQSVLRVVRGAGDLRPEDLVVRIDGAPVEGAVFAAETRGAVRRLDRLVEIDGAPVRNEWDAEALGRTGETFVFERGGRRYAAAGASLAEVCGGVLSAWQAASAGELPALVFTGGRLVETTLPAGLAVRPTAAPAILLPDARVPAGGAPIDLAEGHHLVVVRREGFASRRLALAVRAGVPATLTVALEAAGRMPDGFVLAQSGVVPIPFLIMEREITCAEYLEFLNDPEVIAAIDAAPRPIRFPRTADDIVHGGSWPVSNGRRRLPDGVRPDFPVLGVSFDDALAYARWRTERHRRAGGTGVFGLPTYEEWCTAGGAFTDRNYPFGDRFRPKWVKSCYARPRPSPEPGLRFPIDESLFGVFDMSGGAKEWIDDWYDEARGLRRISGGSWAQGIPELFELFGIGHAPDATADDFGFRLVLREETR